MKKNLIFKVMMALAAGLAFYACEQAETDIQAEPESTPTPGVSRIYYASMEQVGDPDSKVYVHDSKYVVWNADDRISIFEKTTGNSQFRFMGESGDDRGAFELVPGGEVQGMAVPAYYAVYPYDAKTSLREDGVLDLRLPAVQAYAERSFAPGVNTMVSVTEDEDLLFRNLCGFMMVKLYGDNITVTGLSLKGNAGEQIAGRALVYTSVDDAPVVKFADEAVDAVEIRCDAPITLGKAADEATEFWFVLPPVRFEKGFTLTVTTAGGDLFEHSTDKAVEISRNHLTRMRAVEVKPNIPLLDLAGIAKLDDSYVAVCKDAVVVAASQWGALVTDASETYLYLSFANDQVVRGDKIDFMGSKWTHPATGAPYLAVESLSVR